MVVGRKLDCIVTRRSVTEYLQKAVRRCQRPHTPLLQILKVTFIHIMGLILRNQVSYHDTGGYYYKYLLGLLVFSVLHCVVDMTDHSF